MKHLDDSTPNLRKFEEMQKRFESYFKSQTMEDRDKMLKRMDDLIRKLGG